MDRWRIVLLSVMFGAACLVLFNCTNARADVKQEISKKYQEGIAETAAALEQSTAALRGKELSAVDADELSEHLHRSMYLIYLGTIYYEHVNRELPASLEDLAGTEYVPVWPLNPLNNFEPVRILSLADEFAPGDVVLQVCPPEFYSVMNDPRPLSFELAVYGPDPEFALAGEAAPLERNTWAVTPYGALYMIGAHTETAANMRIKWEQMQREAQRLSK